MDKWDIRFMKMAYLISEWTSCNVEGRSIGAVIVKDKRIMTTGYNGAPAGLKTCRERGECMRRKLNIESGTRAEVCYAIHAEQNAILQAAKLHSSLVLSVISAHFRVSASISEHAQLSHTVPSSKRGQKYSSSPSLTVEYHPA